MKKMVLITTDNEVSVIDYPAYAAGDYRAEFRGFYKAISCDCVERVHPKYLNTMVKEKVRLVMLMDEEGIINCKKLNVVGSIFYGTPEHGHPIVGDILIITEEMGFDGPEFAGLDEEVAESVADKVRTIISRYKEAEEKYGEK